MTDVKKHLIIITLTAIVIFSMAACDLISSDDGGSAQVIPTGLAVTAAATTSTSITITWNALPDATFYFVHRWEGTQGSHIYGISVYDTTETTYTSTDLTPDTTYSFRILAFIDSYGYSSFSQTVTAATMIEEIEADPSIPAGLTVRADETTSDSITISWTAVSGASSYIVQKLGGASETFTQVATPTGTTHTSIGLTPNTSYSFRVAALISGEQKPWSSTVSATTPATEYHGAPTELAVAAIDQNSITISWTAISSASSYIIERSEGTQGSFTQIATTTSASHTSTGLNPDTLYSFRVAAVYEGESPWSSTFYAITLAAGNAGGTDVLSGHTYRFVWDYTEFDDFTFHKGFLIFREDEFLAEDWDSWGNYIINGNRLTLTWEDGFIETIAFLTNGQNLVYNGNSFARLLHPPGDPLSGHSFSASNRVIAFSNYYWMYWINNLLEDAGYYEIVDNNLYLDSDFDGAEYDWTISGTGANTVLNGRFGNQTYQWRRQ